MRNLAQTGNPQAQYRLGMAYWSGKDVGARDLEAARMWLGKAAQQGHPAAKSFLERIAAQAR